VAVTEQDVRHVAALARLGLEPERVPTLVQELNGILRHMQALTKVGTKVEPVEGIGAGGMPLRADAGPAYALERAREEFAPSMRDGFFLVPRLATHTDAASDAASDASDVAEGA
jgi:aspartyl-tRNA(Asn)/glutamyl-tRNA(Gln) amidotransferase subunit C